MSKAEERSIETYPKDIEEYVDVNGLKSVIDNNSWQRTIFLKGYHQAEKDIALTIDDIERIHIFLYAVKNNKQGVFTFTRLSDEQYQEVLNRFKNLKK